MLEMGTMPLWIRGRDKTGVRGSELRVEEHGTFAQSVSQPLRGWTSGLFIVTVLPGRRRKSGVGCLIGVDARGR